MKEPLRFRNPTLVVAVLGYVYDADEPVPWEELIDTFTTSAHAWKTVENVVYELVAFGALHRIGAPPKKSYGGRIGPDTRALKPTILGRAWLDRELVPLPGRTPEEDALDEVLAEADRIAERLTAELDLPAGTEVYFDTTPLLEVHTLEPGSEP